MTPVKNPGLMQRLNIGTKLLLIPLIFIISTVMMISYVVIVQQQQRNNIYMMSLIERQRTLTQFYVKDVLMTALKQNKPYKYWRDVFVEHIDVLSNGGLALHQIKTTRRVKIEAVPTSELVTSLAEMQKIMDQMIAREKEFFSINPNDPRFYPVFQQLNDLGDELNDQGKRTIDLYTSYAQSQTDEMIRNVVLLGLGVALLCLILSWILSRRITDPLVALATRAQTVSGGDLSGQALSVTSLDEVGQLTGAFNRMTDNLREMTSQNISSARELSTSTAEILASTQQQSASTQEQVTALQQTSATMEEVRQSGAQISERARQVASEAESAVELTDDGLEAVQRTVGTMLEIRTQVNEVAENIVNLSEKNRAVGDIVALVTDIAEQSNLLALNAAIEAAAAGEQGRSFAVVANEMKHLADQAKDATTQVRRILEDIQKGITRSVLLTEEAVKKVESGRQQTDVSESTIRAMAETTQQSIQAFQQIVAATNQQQLGVEQIFQALQDIRMSTEQTAVSTVQLTKASTGLNVMSQQLQQLISRYTL